MDLLNGNSENSAEALTSTLKDMLKINGNSTEDLQTPEENNSPSKDDNNEEEKKEPKTEEASGPLDPSVQKIDLSKSADGEYIPIVGEEVGIITSATADVDSTTSGSNKVRIRPITKFEWEHKYYNGNLVSVTTDYAAYAIKSRSFAVRVINLKNTSDRLLLRGFTAPVCDVAFAHSTSSLISGVDEDGNFIIWQLSLNGENTSASKKLHVEATPDISTSSLYHRLVWLTYMHCDIDGTNIDELVAAEEGDSESDPSNQKKLLAVTHGRIAEVWDINAAFEVPEDDVESTSKDKLNHTYMTIKGHDDVISDCELSPEGSVLAVASHDGYVKFWQINVQSTEEPTCLHRWKPHGDRPVSLVTFCDDRKQPHLVSIFPHLPIPPKYSKYFFNARLYWRFMLTGCSQNTELKIWCTVTWSCLQKISFEPPPGVSRPLPALKCVLHAASDYLVISDVNRKVVYVLRCITDLKEGKASLSSISQYLLTSPLLSFAIADCEKCKFKNSVVMDDDADPGDDQEDIIQDEENDSDTEEDTTGDLNRRTHGVLIKLISIHTKSLESLNIRFIPKPSDDSSLSISTYNTMSDDLNVVSVDESLSVISPSIENGRLQDDNENQQEQEDEEENGGDSSNDKTALTAREGDQSTILAGHEDDMDSNHGAQRDQEHTPPKPEDGEKFDLAESSGPMTRTNIMDLVGDVTDELPVAQSSPSTRRDYSLPEGASNRGQGEGEASHSPGKSDTHPVLLTPDAFTSSLRKHEGTTSAETSFTHITPFSVDHPSLFSSERDKSVHESVPSPPPGFPPIGNNVTFKASTELRPSSTSPLLPITSSAQSSVDLGASSYHSILTSLTPNGPGPFGDVQNSGYITKDKSPDLISSASTLDSAGGAPVDGRVLIGGPMSGAVGGSGDALFLVGQTPQVIPGDDVTADADSQSSVGSKRSDQIPASSSAPWPKAPDVTMSRPMSRKTSSKHEEFLRTSDLTQHSQTVSRPDSVLHADITGEEQETQSYNVNAGADLLAAIVSLQKQQEDLMRSHQREINKKTNQIMKNVDTALRKFEQQQGDKLDRALKSMTDSQRRFHAESKAYNATSAEQVSGKMDRAIKYELKNTVLPGLSRSLDPFKDQMHSTLAQKLTATDSLLRDSIGKLARSKETVEAIGGAAGRAVQSQVHSAYRDTFITSVVPAFEKSCNNMFQQLSHTFQRGADEIATKIEKQLQSRVKAEVDSMQVAEKQARDTLQELKEVAGQAHSKISSTMDQKIPALIKNEMKSIHDHLITEVTKSIKVQHEVALKEQKLALSESIQSALAELPIQQGYQRTKLPGDKTLQSGITLSSAGPQPPTFEQQQQAILRLLHQGNLNSAFQRALTASDLNLVMYVCEMVDPAIVFGSSPCPLHQPILLSLIQQLACDLGHHTATKLKYLQEAVMNLDRTHQVTQEHMHTVLDSLVKNLGAHISSLSGLPTDASNTMIIKQMKMLAMAAQSLI